MSELKQDTIKSLLMEMNPLKIITEVTKEKLKFHLKFPENQMLIFTFPKDFESFGIKENEVIYSFFKDRKLIVSDVSDLRTIIDKFNVFFNLAE